MPSVRGEEVVLFQPFLWYVSLAALPFGRRSFYIKGGCFGGFISCPVSFGLSGGCFLDVYCDKLYS